MPRRAVGGALAPCREPTATWISARETAVWPCMVSRCNPCRTTSRLVQLFQTPDHFVIYAPRRSAPGAGFVPISDRPHGVLRQKTGDARARWEGETLVVETTLFGSNRLQQIGAGRNIRRLTERFTREMPESGPRPVRLHRGRPAALDQHVDGRHLPAADRRSHVRGGHSATKATTPSENILRGLRALDGTPREPCQRQSPVSYARTARRRAEERGASRPPCPESAARRAVPPGVA